MYSPIFPISQQKIWDEKSLPSHLNACYRSREGYVCCVYEHGTYNGARWGETYARLPSLSMIDICLSFLHTEKKHLSGASKNKFRKIIENIVCECASMCSLAGKIWKCQTTRKIESFTLLIIEFYFYFLELFTLLNSPLFFMYVVKGT